MILDLNLHNYIDYEVTNVMPLKGKYGYRVFLKYMDGSKIPQQKSGFDTMKEAKSARDQTVGELFKGTYVVYANVKVKDFMEHWVNEDIQNRVESSDTYETYSGIVRNHIIPEIGRKKMVHLNRADIQKLYNKKAEYSPSVAKLVKTVMNVSMEYAKDKKIISENPAVGVSLPKTVQRGTYHSRTINTQKTLTQDQMLLLIQESRNTPIHMQVLFNVMLGLRRREINAVKYSDVDYINRTLSLSVQLGKKIRTKKEEFAPKTFTKQEVPMKTESSVRVIPIPDLVFEAILEERKVYEKNRSRRKAEFQDLDYICCSSYGRPRSKDYHFPHYKQLLRDCGLPDIRWHDLRKSFSTLLLKNDFSPKAVSKLLGHSKEIISVDVYGDNENIIADCVDVIQPYIEEVIPEEDSVDTDEEDVLINIEEYLL